MKDDSREIYLQFGHAMKERRLDLRYTQSQLASKYGSSEGYIGDVERGVKTVSLAVACRIASVLGVPLWKLLMPEDQKQEQLLKTREAYAIPERPRDSSDLEKRVENLEMQIEILTNVLKGK